MAIIRIPLARRAVEVEQELALVILAREVEGEQEVAHREVSHGFALPQSRWNLPALLPQTEETEGLEGMEVTHLGLVVRLRTTMVVEAEVEEQEGTEVR
jgi:hypothetical protein